MGFRTLAIQKRSSEVWQVLGDVKAEFGKFGAAIEKVEKKLAEATTQLQGVGARKRVLERKLQKVEALPSGATRLSLPANGAAEGEPVFEGEGEVEETV